MAGCGAGFFAVGGGGTGRGCFTSGGRGVSFGLGCSFFGAGAGVSCCCCWTGGLGGGACFCGAGFGATGGGGGGTVCFWIRACSSRSCSSVSSRLVPHNAQSAVISQSRIDIGPPHSGHWQPATSPLSQNLPLEEDAREPPIAGGPMANESAAMLNESAENWPEDS